MGFLGISTAVEKYRIGRVEKADCKLFIPKVKRGKVVDVYDGDTVTIAALPFPCKCVGEPVLFKVRLLGIDSPEMRGGSAKEKKAATEARDALHALIFGQIIRLHEVKFDKYGRLLATLTIGDLDINQWMLEKKLAVPYDGKKKPKFSEI